MSQSSRTTRKVGRELRHGDPVDDGPRRHGDDGDPATSSPAVRARSTSSSAQPGHDRRELAQRRARRSGRRRRSASSTGVAAAGRPGQHVAPAQHRDEAVDGPAITLSHRQAPRPYLSPVRARPVRVTCTHAGDAAEAAGQRRRAGDRSAVAAGGEAS